MYMRDTKAFTFSSCALIRDVTGCRPKFYNYLEIDSRSDLAGRKGTVVGWGKTYADQLVTTNGAYSDKQQKLEVPLLSETDCSAQFGQLEETQLCAGGEAGEDSCRGDSGGPLLIQREEEEEGRQGILRPWYLLGIVSFGSRDCGDGQAALYTRVSQYADWIQLHLQN